MIGKTQYLEMKKYLKHLSKPQIRQICEDVELNDRESETLINWYDSDSFTDFSMNEYVCYNTSRAYIKDIMSKINNYNQYKKEHE